VAPTLRRGSLASSPLSISPNPVHRSGCYKACGLGNSRNVLASAIAAVFLRLIVAGTMWYGSAAHSLDVVRTTRYQWIRATSRQKSTVVWPRPSRTVPFQGRGLCRDS